MGLLRSRPGGAGPGPDRGDRLVAFVFALIGFLVGLIAILWLADSLPHPPVHAARTGNRPGAPAELWVDLFGHRVINKTSADEDALRREAAWWVVVPSVTIALIGAAGGGYLGWRLGSRLSRRKRGIAGPAPSDPAADYGEAPGTGGAGSR